MDIILILILGGLIGISSALLGLGGNILIVPLLPLLPMASTLTLKSIVATGIFIVFFLTLVNVISFYRQKLIDFKLVFTLIIPTSLFSFLSSFHVDKVNDNIIKTLLILVMISMVIRLLLFKKKDSNSVNELNYPLLLGAGAVSGSLAGLTGVGTGVLLGPLLLSLNLTDEKKVSPTINFLIMVACFFSSLNYLSFSNFNYPQSGLVRIDIALMIFIPAIVTAVIGRRINTSISPKLRRWVVSSALGLLILKIIWTF